MKTQPTPSPGSHHINLNSVLRIAAFVALIALIAMPLFSSSSASSSRQEWGVGTASTPTLAGVSGRVLPKRESAWISSPVFKSNFLPSSPLWLVLPQSSESIATFEYPGCTVPKDSFDLGETVCARVTGANLGADGRAARRIGWVSPYGSLAQGAEIISDPQTGSYAIPSAPTQTFTDDGGGTVTVDNRGTWKVSIYSAADGSLVQSAAFTVHDPQTPSVDLSVIQGVNEQESQVSAGSSSVFHIFVTNNGPDSANVFVGESVPANTTFVSFVQNPGGPTFTCTTPSPGGTGTISCQVASMSRGDTVSFDFAYQVDPGTAAGTVITNFVNLDTGVLELQPNDNSSTATATVPTGGGGGGCTLNCPDNVNAIADTTEGGERGTHVTFDAAEPSGTCGAITATPASGAFFPVGSTTVNVVSETGGGSCSFIVTVEDTGSDPPTISCPANQTANADTNCEATVNLGNPTVSGDNVTVTVTRSDGRPMYDCDSNGNNCVRKTTDLPFAAGVTTVTWTATSHDAPGGNETGNASCTQTVTVNDVTPPNITPPPNQAASADASCQAAVPDFASAATVSDNCACASSDESENCANREPITITQSPAAGTMVGLGPHTITLTANDGSSNNNGAGNSATAQVTFTVNDTTPPAITCPGNITQPTAPGTCSAVVNPGAATATDNCDSSPTITGTRSDAQPLANPYPAGTTTITWRATDDAGNYSECTQTITVNAPAATALGPANIWVGLKNSDSVGLRFDLKAEIYKGDTLIGSGEVFNVVGGSSGFNNAILRTIAIAQSQAASFCPGDQMKIKLSVRAGATGHLSGWSRLWYHDSAANSRFAATVGGNTNTYYLLDGFVTGSAAGPGPKKTIDVFVHRNQFGNAYKPFGTWVKTF